MKAFFRKNAACAAEMPVLKGYRALRKRRLFLVAAVLAVASMLFVASVCSGSSSLSAYDALLALFGLGSKHDATVVWGLRMPHALTAVVCGAGLALAGCLYQCLLRNPLASASTLGVSNGAAFGASVAVVIFGAGSATRTSTYAFNVTDPALVVVFAFAGAMISTVFVILLSRVGRFAASSIVLAGVAMGMMFQGGVALVQYFADDAQVAAVVFWTFGDLGRVTYTELLFLSLVTVLAGTLVFAVRWKLDAFESGDESASGLGVNVKAMRAYGMLLASFVTSCIVSFVGIIGFVGLVSPHMMRRIGGGAHEYLLPASAAMGSVLLLAGDLIARLAAAPVVLPVGAITSFMGAPIFLYVLFRDKRCLS